MSREDFWQAVQQGIALEGQWIDLHNQVQQRALAAASATITASVQIYNANVARWNALLAQVNAEVAEGRLNLDIELGKLQEYRARLQKTETEIRVDANEISRFSNEWSAWQSDKGTELQAFGEELKLWNSEVENDAKRHAGDISGQQLLNSKNGTDIQRYSAIMGKIQAVAGAAATLLGARTDSARQQVQSEGQRLTFDQVRNQTAINVSDLTVRAQQAAAQIDVQQAQWVDGQQRESQIRIADTIASLAGSLAAASDVTLGSAAYLNVSE